MKVIKHQLEKYLQQLNQELTNENTALWGIMNAQNMVEHLSLILIGSIGKWGREFTGDEGRAAKNKAIFFAARYPFPKSVTQPGMENGQAPPPLRCATMEESKALLQKSYEKFINHFENNPTDKVQHPYFGLFSFEEWVHFHARHFEHHLMQFGLIDYPLTAEMEVLIKEIRQKLKIVYSSLTVDHKAKWGKMNAHQCVEHLGLIFLYSTGKFKVPFKGDKEVAKQLWKPFLEAENPWKTVFPSRNFGEPKPVRTENIELAKKALKKTFIQYTHYCMENPKTLTPHGALGDITTTQWLQVHSKHIDHHLSQFGVI